MKYSVTSYSFSQLLRNGEITQLGMIALAKEIGFDAIEFTNMDPEEGYTDLEYAVALRKESERIGLPIISHTIGANLVAENLEEEIKALKHKIDICELLGAHLLRHDVMYAYPEGKPQDFDYYVEDLAKVINEVTEYARSKGIRTCTENHGYISQDADRVKKLIKTVNNDNFGWLVDIGNFMCTGGDCLESVKIGSKYAFHVHAKDFNLLAPDTPNGFNTSVGTKLEGTIIGQGVVPVKECIDVIKKTGYDGYITVEFEGPQPCVNAIKEGLEFLKKC